MNKEQRAIIFFDSECILCNRYVNFVIKHEKTKEFFFAPVQGKNYRDLEIDKEHPAIDSIVLYDQHIYVKTKAILKIMAHMGLFLKLISFIASFIPTFLSDKVYDIIARNRYQWFGKTESCSLVPADYRKRILE